MGEISNKTLTILLIVAIVVSVIGTYVSFSRLKAAGRATTGTVDLGILAAASINVVDTALDFGDCTPDATTGCTADSETGGGCCTAGADYLTIENDGNKNVSLDVKTDTLAAAFIGGTSPSFKFKTGQGEAGSCVGSTGLTTTYTELLTTNILACENLGYVNAKDTVNLYAQLFLPSDTPPAASSTATLTFTGTGI